VHSKNLRETLLYIESNFKNPYVIAIDASLGSMNSIGKVFIEDSPLSPGLALNKNLPQVGDLSITGVVNISGNYEFMVLQNTRLYTVMLLAKFISNSLSQTINLLDLEINKAKASS
ncbi:MAG: spore protease YyaC, partial [Clostridium sp.]